ncbi:MAG: exosortase E/protease, VPEID-CTERM system [Pseudomonadota bacterium]
MSITTPDQGPAARLSLAPWLLPVAVGLMVAAELATLSVLYKHAIGFHCQRAMPEILCAGLSETVVRAFLATVALAGLATARPAFRHAMPGLFRTRPRAAGVALNLAGFACLMLPLSLVASDMGEGAKTATYALWAAGALMAVAGTGLALIRFEALGTVLAAGGAALPALIVTALMMPELAVAAGNIWYVPALTQATFGAVTWLMALAGHEITASPETLIVGLGDFHVRIWHYCSGIEGIALISAFLLFYAWLFKERNRIDRVLVFLPLAILASWSLNIVRIAVLIWIGAAGAPELALEGFHSHAGWLVFSAVALGMMLALHALPWVRREAVAGPAPAAPSPSTRLPLVQDWNAARLVPFMAMMAGALLSSTFAEVPEILYPARLAFILGALWLFRAAYLALDWRVDRVAVVAGGAIGIGWLMLPYEPDAPLMAALEALPLWLLAVWIIARMIGSALVIPLVEELVFRSYLVERLNPGGRAGLVVAVIASSLAFGALHDRWIEAGLAGLVFAWLVVRPGGRLADGVVAHVVANATIVAWVLVMQDWAAI